MTKLLTSGILFSTAVNVELVAKPLTLSILGNLLKSTGTVFNLSTSILSISAFKLAKSDFATN